MEMGNTLEEMDNKKILIVGNGFDLAHNLKTRYSDVLEVFKKRKSFYGLYINRKIDTGFDEKIADNIPKALESYDSKNLEKLDKIIRNNSWVEYYSGCGAELDLWIDFERELVPVLDIFDFILSADINFEDGAIEFERNSFFKFNCYFSRYFTILNNKIFVKNYYIDSSYELYIYGHSLDETDKDVLKFAIGDFDDKNQFQMKARKVIIYYYDQQDFELKVINLITLFGRDIVEKNMDDNKIIFIKIDSNID